MNRLRLAHAPDPVSRAQAARVAKLLAARAPAVLVVRTPVSAAADAAEPLERLLAELAEGRADAVVWRAAALPEKLPAGVSLGALLRALDSRSLYAAKGPPALALLPARSRVAACDAVTRAQIMHRYPWLSVEVAPVCPDVIDELRSGSVDAACLPPEALECCAASGLRVEPVSSQELLPAVGQGIVALIVADAPGSNVVQDLDQPRVRTCLAAERTFVRHASASADAVGTACATVRKDCLELTGLLAERDGVWLVTDAGKGPALLGADVARDVADSCAALFRRRGAWPASGNTQVL